MRTAGPTTGAALAHLEFLDRALDSVAARRSLLGRDDPANPFVPCQRRQSLPGRSRRRFRAEGLAQVRRGFVHGTGFVVVLHLTSVIRIILKHIRPNVSAGPHSHRYPTRRFYEASHWHRRHLLQSQRRAGTSSLVQKTSRDRCPSMGWRGVHWTDEEGKPVAGTTAWSIGSAEATTLRPAPPPSWSIIAWRISTHWSKLCAKKAATYSRRLTTPSMESLAGSSIRKETRWNYGSRLPANEKGPAVRRRGAPRVRTASRG